MNPPDQLRMFWLLVRHEIRVLVTERSLPLVCGLLAVMIGYGLMVGLKQTHIREQMVADVLAHQHQTAASNILKLKDVLSGAETPVPFSNPANPAAMAGGLAGRFVILPSTPLAPLAVAQSDLLPNYYQMTYRSKVQFMYDSEIENPWNLLSGHFDLAFVIVYMLPLMILAISYNLLSAEQEGGTLRMLCSQPLTVTTLILAKVFVRAIALLGCAILTPLATLLVLRPEMRTLEHLNLIMCWCVLVIAYALIWFALAALVNTIRRSSSANALILIAAWTVWVLVVPVALNLFVSLAQPAPSRTELATQTRIVTAEALKRYEDLYSADYRYAVDPKSLLVKEGHIEIPARMMAFFLAKRDVDESIEKLLMRFDRQVLAQQQLIDRFGFLSPAIVAHEGMASIAGNGSRRHLAFKDQVDRFHGDWRRYFWPRIADSHAMTVQDVESMPQWRWVEVAASEASGDAWSRAGVMFVLAVVLGASGVARARRYSIV